MKEQEDI